MIKEIIKNRKGENIVVLIDKKENQKGLSFVMHGYGHSKEQPHIQSMAQVFKKNDFTVIRFDTANSIGESGGKLEDATITKNYEDLEDVIEWSKDQNWYQEPFWLSGHSSGGFSVTFFAINHPKKTKAIAPISCFVSGELFIQTKDIQPVLEEWKKTGMRQWESSTKPGLIKKSKYDFVEDALEHNLLRDAYRIKCPVLMVVGDKDETTPLEHQEMLFNLLETEKEFHIINGLKHTPQELNHVKELEDIMGKWIAKIRNT